MAVMVFSRTSERRQRTGIIFKKVTTPPNLYSTINDPVVNPPSDAHPYEMFVFNKEN